MAIQKSDATDIHFLKPYKRAASLRLIAIQDDLGSNSHMAALAMLGTIEFMPCGVSAEIIDRLLAQRVDAAVLPIENSLHGSVAEHYDRTALQPGEEARRYAAV